MDTIGSVYGNPPRRPRPPALHAAPAAVLRRGRRIRVVPPGRRALLRRPASLSAQLAALEAALGVALFERGRGKVAPTKAGRVLLPRAQAMLVAADDLGAAARDFVDPLAGVLRLGVIPTLSPYLLPALAPALKRDFPKLALRWTEDKTPALVAELDAGRIDAALVALEAELGRVEHAVIGADRFVLATRLGDPLGAPRAPLRRDDLKGAPLLLLEEGHCLRDQALSFCARARPSELDYRATSLATLVQMVAAGQGVTLLPALAAPVEAARAGLQLREFAAPAPQRTIALVWRRHSPLAGALATIAGSMRAAFPHTEPHAAPRAASRRAAPSRARP
jgi:LysR family hydrogen peroxide-inducible transcriptional activator